MKRTEVSPLPYKHCLYLTLYVLYMNDNINFIYYLYITIPLSGYYTSD